MRAVEPKVFLIAETKLIPGHVHDYLEAIGAKGWATEARSDAEVLSEIAGRLCYRSFKPGLNANVTKIREGNAEYLDNVIKQKHGSVFEHASVSFIFHNVSRVFTHELVRHRVGTGISQESMRYVRLGDSIPFWTPSVVKDVPDAEITKAGAKVMAEVEKFYKLAVERFGLDSDQVDFTFKKKITSALRRWAPDGMATSILWTANMRALRNILVLRTNEAAEEEIRLVFDKVGHIMHSNYPNIFGDLTRNVRGEYTSLRGADKI